MSAGASGADAAAESGAADGTVVEVRPGIWRTSASVVSGPYELSTNAYLVVEETGTGAEAQTEAMLVDTAWWAGVGTAHLDALFEVSGVAPEAVSTIVITHAHRDHSGSVNLLEGRTGAVALLHRAEAATVDSLRSYQGLATEEEAVAWYGGFGLAREAALGIIRTKEPDNPFSVEAVRWIEDGETVRVGSREFTVVHTPGHTPGHVCIIEPATGILFSGDALLPRGHGNPHVTVRAFTPPDPLGDYVAGLERLRAMGPFTDCLPGHGPVVEDVDALFASQLALAERKLEMAFDAVDDRPASAAAIIARMAWRTPFETLTGDPLFLSFADGLARLRRLAALGRIEAVPEGGVERYRRSHRSGY